MQLIGTVGPLQNAHSDKLVRVAPVTMVMTERLKPETDEGGQYIQV